MNESIKILWDIFTKRKLELVSKNENSTYTKDHVDKVLSGKILDPQSEKFRPKDNTAINLSVKTLLNKIWLNLEDLKGKRILDIWWGFTGIPFLLKDLEWEIIVVDPIFSSDVKEEISRNRDKIFDLIWNFDKKNFDAYQEWKKQDYFYSLNYEFNNILADLDKWEQEYLYKNLSVHKNIIILPIPAEEISDINSESIDIIFINHTITKSQVEPYKVLQKSYNLLKKWWKIYITESWDIDYSKFIFWNEDFDVKIKKFDNHGYNKNTVLILEKL